jgi:hypothetical protein
MDVRVSLKNQKSLKKTFLEFRNPWHAFAVSTDILNNVHFMYDTGSELIFTDQNLVPLFSLYGCKLEDFTNCMDALSTKPPLWTRIWSSISQFFDIWNELEDETDELLIPS